MKVQKVSGLLTRPTMQSLLPGMEEVPGRQGWHWKDWGEGKGGMWECGREKGGEEGGEGEGNRERKRKNKIEAEELGDADSLIVER